MTLLQMLAAGSLFLASVACSLRSELLSHAGRGWPSAPRLVRWPLAIVALVCLGRACEIIARHCDVSASETAVYAAMGLSAVLSGVNVLLQRVGWLGHPAPKPNGIDYSRHPPTARPH